jgi:hypothetical protein
MESTKRALNRINNLSKECHIILEKIEVRNTYKLTLMDKFIFWLMGLTLR